MRDNDNRLIKTCIRHREITKQEKDQQRCPPDWIEQYRDRNAYTKQTLSLMENKFSSSQRSTDHGMKTD